MVAGHGRLRERGEARAATATTADHLRGATSYCCCWLLIERLPAASLHRRQYRREEAPDRHAAPLQEATQHLGQGRAPLRDSAKQLVTAEISRDNYIAETLDSYLCSPWPRNQIYYVFFSSTNKGNSELV